MVHAAAVRSTKYLVRTDRAIALMKHQDTLPLQFKVQRLEPPNSKQRSVGAADQNGSDQSTGHPDTAGQSSLWLADSIASLPFVGRGASEPDVLANEKAEGVLMILGRPKRLPTVFVCDWSLHSAVAAAWSDWYLLADIPPITSRHSADSAATSFLNGAVPYSAVRCWSVQVTRYRLADFNILQIAPPSPQTPAFQPAHTPSLVPGLAPVSRQHGCSPAAERTLALAVKSVLLPYSAWRF